jgi:hypothetical protein
VHLTREQALEAAYAHAKARWRWDDRAVIEELYDREGPWETKPEVEAWIDDVANEYGLADPQEPWGWGHSL